MQTTSVRKAYRYRLEPSAQQRAQLERFAGARRFVWNWALATWKAYYIEHGKSIPMKTCPARGCVLDRDLNAARNIRDEGYRILAAGHADKSNACRAPVRLSTESVA